MDGQEVRLLDDFKMGPNLVRGFAPAGIGPRDITPGTSNDALGRHELLGREPGIPVSVLLPAKGCGLPWRGVHRCGSVWGYKGETTSPHWRNQRPDSDFQRTGVPTGTINCQCGMQYVDDTAVRMSVGASIIWDSPFGPLRFDFAYPIMKQCVRSYSVLRLRRRNAVLIAAGLSSWAGANQARSALSAD